MTHVRHPPVVRSRSPLPIPRRAESPSPKCGKRLNHHGVATSPAVAAQPTIVTATVTRPGRATDMSFLTSMLPKRKIPLGDARVTLFPKALGQGKERCVSRRPYNERKRRALTIFEWYGGLNPPAWRAFVRRVRLYLPAPAASLGPSGERAQSARPSAVPMKVGNRQGSRKGRPRNPLEGRGKQAYESAEKKHR